MWLLETGDQITVCSSLCNYEFYLSQYLRYLDQSNLIKRKEKHYFLCSCCFSNLVISKSVAIKFYRVLAKSAFSPSVVLPAITGSRKPQH